MDELLESAKKEVLVEMVKLAQKKKMEGSKGQWKEFLNSYDKKFGASLSDPSRRSVDSLLSFLKTFTEDDDLQFFKRALDSHSNREKVVSFTSSSPDNESAEQRLVRLTLEHPLYPMDYTLPSYVEDWIVIKGNKKSKAIDTDEMIAIDCEMVLCTDGSEFPVRVCAVDKSLKEKVNIIVKRDKEIADYRTSITGISAEDLADDPCSLKKAQKAMKRILSSGAILIGHSLNNDLHALKVDYSRVIDTSYIFKYDGTAIRRPSLSFLCKSVLNYELRKKGDPHDCLEDARAAMKLVLARLEGKSDGSLPEEDRELENAKLIIHRIPVDVRCEDLKSIIPGDFSLEVKAPKKGKEKGKEAYTAIALFENEQEAAEAFENLEGDLEKDSSGRPQKVVSFQLDSGKSSTLCVCKTSKEDVISTLVTKKRSGETITSDASKKMRTDECEIHEIEIERLKEEVRKRDEEIISREKIITALARKQGL